ncbi:MAG: hypothetical protein IJ266_03945 [Elusimicrobiaceae bacterium]|nr:hypothetical protein [Elusimicrobiaceae bacterium]
MINRLHLSTAHILDASFLWISGICLFFVMAMPDGYSAIKTIAFILLFGFTLLECVVQKYTFKTLNLYATGIFVLYFSLSLLYGIHNGYSFSSQDFGLARMFLMNPICSLLIGTGLTLHKRGQYLPGLLVYLGCAICVLNLGIILNGRGVIPNFYVLQLFEIKNNSISETGLFLRISNEPALMFLLPYMIVSLAHIKSHPLSVKICLFVGVAVGCIDTLLSGRKSLELVVGLSSAVFLIQSLRRFSIKTFVKNVLWWSITSVAFILGVKFISQKFAILNIFFSAYQTMSLGLSSAHTGMMSRTENIHYLINGWLENPITFFIGHGLNSYAPESIASWTSKWSYEVFYHALLYQAGLIGLGLLLGAYYLLIRPAAKVYFAKYDTTALACIISSLCFMFTSATNPMIASMWFWIFLWAFYFQYRQLNRKINED